MPNIISPIKIKNLISDAEKLAPYRPNQEVNQFFSSLYHLAKDEDSYLSPEIKKTSLLKVLHKICAQAESQMEHYRADRIINATDPISEIKSFPYRNNYQELSSLEYHLLLSQIGTFQNILFVGSGSLPMTAIFFARQWGICSTLIDIDANAVKKSKKLIEKLGLQEKIQVIHSDFLDFSSKERYDVVFLASLLFNGSACDQCILEHLSFCLDFRVAMLRSAKGTRQLLYQKLELSLIKKYLDLQLILHPQNNLINSMLLCTKHC